MLSPDEKLDEALKETFPASDAFYLPPVDSAKGQVLEEKRELSEHAKRRLG